MVSRLVRLLTVSGLAVAGLGTFVRAAYSHPLHTTLTEVSVNAGQVQIVIRAFVDDFSAVANGHGRETLATIPALSDSTAARYLGAKLVLTDGTGRRIALTPTNIRRAGDLVWITLTAPVARGTAVRLTNNVLFERYDDQVNIVQATIDGRRQTLLFTKRDSGAGRAL
jgi:hypothetical protein